MVYIRRIFAFVLVFALLCGASGRPQPAYVEASQPGPGPEDTPVTRWVSPQDEQPITYREWSARNPQRPLTVQESGALPSLPKAGGPAILVLIHSDLYLYEDMQPVLARYLGDLQNEGYSVFWYAFDGGNPQDVRNLLKYYRDTYAIEGALLIGNITVPWYEMDDDFYGSAEFPIDLYYMDLDGAWGDADGDGLFDSHTNGEGSTAPDIYVSRLYGSPLSGGSLSTEVALLRNYFQRNHTYRTISQYSWHEINSTGQALLLPDDGHVEVALPFPFTFYGNTYTSAYVSSNGFLSFEPAYEMDFGGNACLPDGEIPGNAIYAFWDDLLPATAGTGSHGVVYAGQAGEDIFVVEWDRVSHKDNPEMVETFQILLHRGGEISLQYKTVGDASSMTAGIENAQSMQADQITCNGSGEPILPGTLKVFHPLDSYVQDQDPGYGWEEINENGDPVTLDPDGAAHILLPFDFPFYDQTYGSVYVNANGFLSFGTKYTNTGPVCTPNTSAPSNAIYAYWTDLTPAAGGGIYQRMVDLNTFVIEWDTMQRTGSTDTATFQVLLSRNGTIKLQYKAVATDEWTAAGLERHDSSRSLPYACENHGGEITAGMALAYYPRPYYRQAPYSLAYIDEDWAYYGEWGYDHLALIYGANVESVWAYGENRVTTRNHYLERMGAGPEFVHVMSHGYPQGHAFGEPGGNYFIFSSDVDMLNPPASFYNLFVCSGARYVESEYVGGQYLLDPYSGADPPTHSGAGLVVVGSTKTGSMLNFESFYGPLGLGRTFGQAYLDWFNVIAAGGFDISERQWHYGMALLGDPTLHVGHQPNPAPNPAAINPPEALAGSGAFTLQVTGVNFVSSSVVRWEGNDLPTTYHDSTYLTAEVPGELIAQAHVVDVTVFNPGPGGGTSIPLWFMVTNPRAVLTTIEPEVVEAGGAGFTLAVTGEDFFPEAVVRWGETELPTTYVDTTHLMAQVTREQIAAAGFVDVTVFNVGPGGGGSSPLVLTINHPVAALAAVEPAVVEVGSGDFSLAVDGSGFFAASVVRWNGALLETRVLSPTRLEADVPAAFVANAGIAAVTVLNPTPGGGVSSALSVAIHNPLASLGTLLPSSVEAGGEAFSLVVNGANFVQSSVVRWNGAPLETRFIDSNRLEVDIPANLIEAAGTANLSVFTPGPGGGESNTLSFSITETGVPAVNRLYLPLLLW